MLWAEEVRRMGGRSSECSDSSSGEEDGDSEWKAAINSVAVSSSSDFLSSFMNGSSATSNNTQSDDDDDDAGNRKQNPQLKYYQLKAQKLLDDMLGKKLEMVRDSIDAPHKDPEIDEGGIHLFKHAPRGIVFDYIDECQQPRKKPRILPGKEIDEKSKKFRRQIQSAAVNAEDIMATARDAYQKALARLEAKDAAAKAAAKREEERVAELKRIRGERWLPSIAREMRVNFQG
ncbi:uncharacterized protein LOC121267133 [Juglans microcarpa x Juglans regia]|uniref:uncharacterized protein LOC121267133 n=1 Tax=Juglans microcarpa x Juglans regia TaxID=2249226 RepID=UPI001B7E8AD0|nr:uncharacterized protein LOC121267133 [Juglans microcarpa x Juglans regia]